ncbi:AK1BA reductase, partial [Uria aalge]|nr:AK1BA reductase [Uria aalge]
TDRRPPTGTMSSPCVELSNKMKMPILGLGTWQAPPGKVEEVVKFAIDAGYRLFDCAYFYQNENEIGNAVQQKIKEGAVKREDLFIVTKLWNTFHEKSLVKVACKMSLAALKLDYLDLYLIHFPMGFKAGEELHPLDDKGMSIPSDTDFLDTWEAMEELVDCGLVKAIGVSNFNHEQIERILNKPGLKYKPVNNQLLHRHGNVQECSNSFTGLVCFSTQNHFTEPHYKKEDQSVQLCNEIKEIAVRHHRTPAQVLLRFLIQRDVIVIPKSDKPQRVEENIKVFDFELSKKEMDVILTFNRNWRAVPVLQAVNHKDYPFKAEY